jgi:cell division protein FtsI/penicillin-binding protein 2
MPRPTIALVLLFLGLSTVRAQPLRLGGIDRRHPDVVALVADARTGRVLGGVRVAEADAAKYYPGSLFKLAIAVAALDGNGRADAEHRCTGADTVDGHAYRCWLSAGHGRVDLDDAIAVSCNLYFRWLARGISTSAIASSARSLGLLPRDRAVALSDETILGEAAPLSARMLLETALALASRGRLARPSLQLASARYRPLYRGLRECVRTGTARSAWSRRISIGGKTGTSDVPDVPGRHAGWFIGFAPFDHPRYAIVVLDRNGLGSEAAAVAREVLETLL